MMLAVHPPRKRGYRTSSRAVMPLAAAGAALILALATSTSAHAAATKPVLTFGTTETATNLNPALQPSSGAITSLAYAALTHYTNTGEITPALATSWRYVGSDDKTFQLTLRKGVRFSDGSPLNAAAVKTWIDYFIHAKGPFTTIIPLKSVSTSGKWTVRLHLAASDPEVAYQLSDGSTNTGFIGSPKGAADPATLNANTDGAGPYVADPSASVAGSTYTFVPNKYYYDQKAIRFSKVVVKMITSPSTMLAAVESGQLDVAAGDNTTEAAAKAHGLDVIKAVNGWDGLLLMNRSPKLTDGTSANPLGNVKVRQALSYAINRPAIVKALLPASGSPTSEAPTIDGFVPSYNNYYPYNPKKAKALLAAAGYPKGFTLSVLSQTSFGTLGDPVLQAIAQYLSAIGVTLDIKPEPAINQWVAAYESKTYPASGFVQNELLTMYTFYGYYLLPNKGPSSELTSDDPAVDSLYKKALTAKNPTKYWQAISEQIVKDADEIPVLDDDTFYYTNGHIGGVTPTEKNSTMIPTDWYPKG